MDQVKIGKFIKVTRKEKLFTQREVADRLNISEKTVSKWETGRGLPEVSFMLPLCELLGITVNELLSGERLDEKQYYKRAEKNLMTETTDSKAKNLLVSEYVKKLALRNFKCDSYDIDILQKFYCPELSLKRIMDMIGEWNTLDYKGRYFEMFAVVIEGKIVGTISLYQHSQTVISIGPMIFDEYFGHGYGEAAMNRALEICLNKGYKIVCQQVRVTNAASISLHKKLGFETDNYVYKNQKGHDVILFFKSL